MWIFCTKRSLHKINNIHERCLRLILQNCRSEYERLLQNANEKSVYQKCTDFFLIEVYKYLNALSPDIMNRQKLRQNTPKLKQNPCNLRNFHAFESQNPRPKKFGLDSIVPKVIRNSVSLFLQRTNKKVPLISWSRQCCKTYIHHVGYI